MPKIVHNLWQPSPLSSPFPREKVRVRDGVSRGHPPDVSCRCLFSMLFIFYNEKFHYQVMD